MPQNRFPLVKLNSQKIGSIMSILENAFYITWTAYRAYEKNTLEKVNIEITLITMINKYKFKFFERTRLFIRIS